MGDSESIAFERLSRIRSFGELRAAVLALLLTPDSQRERRAWREETKGLSTASALRQAVEKLGPATRLPWLDKLLTRASKTTVLDRQTLIEAARRVMAADGQLRPIDRLQWMAMRHRLKEAPSAPVKVAPDAPQDMTQLSLHALRQIALFTAFLSRMVPGQDGGTLWYQASMNPWLIGAALPPCESPDADALAHALIDVQALPWMIKPVVVRAWIDSALLYSTHGRLHRDAADALRLATLLLDSPMPPELARHYIEPSAE